MAQVFYLVHAEARRRALGAVTQAPDGWRVTVEEQKRTTDQNAKLHAILSDIARQAEWMGRRLSIESWKALFVSGHAIATKQGGEVLPGIEGEFVAIRESTARMGKRRAASLIEYVLAWCALNDIELSETA